MTKKKKRTWLLTPKKLKNELEAIGESCNKKEIIATGAALLGIGLLLMKLFALKIIFFVPIALCLLYVFPFVILNAKKRKYEKNRFQNAASYLSHMNQSFQDTKSILTSLKETERKYRDGKMRNTLRAAIDHIQKSKNVRLGEQEALQMIEAEYDCRKMRTFHDFIVKAEAHGGECSKELKLLEKIKNEWVLAVENGYRTFCSNIYLMYFEAVILLIICAFIQQRFPGEFSVYRMRVVQIANTLLICLFIFLFKFFDRRSAKSLLADAKTMAEEEVEKGYATIEKLDIKNNLKRGLPYGLIFIVLFGVLFFFTKSKAVLAIGLVIILIVSNIYNISYFAFYAQIKSELAAGVPEWVFDVVLLLQRENVQVAILKSIDNAPPVLKHELYSLQQKIIDAPADPNSYLTFLDRFEIDGVEDAMRTLYSISQGTGSAQNIGTIAETNMRMLSEAEKRRIERDNAFSTVYIYFPILPCVFVLLVYGGALLYNVFTTVMSLLS